MSKFFRKVFLLICLSMIFIFGLISCGQTGSLFLSEKNNVNAMNTAVVDTAKQ